MVDREQIPIDYTWVTELINPQVIANQLRGVLRESNDVDSKWHIEMYYSRSLNEGPVFVLKLNPYERKIFIDIPGPRLNGHKTWYASNKLTDITDIKFVVYTNPYTRKSEADILFNAANKLGERANVICVSSAYHLIGGEQD